MVRENNYEREGSRAEERHVKDTPSMRTHVRRWKCMRLSGGCKKYNKNEYRGMRCIDRT
jgi:hypothetical protein